MQGRNGDADVENGRVDTVGEGEGGMNWEMRFDIRTLPCVKQIASGNFLYSTELSSVLCDDQDVWDGWVSGRPKRVGIYVYI